MRGLAELIGIIAVILSLLFVAFELRQSNRIAIGNAELAMAALNADVNRVIFESDGNDALFVKLSSRNPNLTPEEYQRASYIAYMHFNRWNATQRSHDNGLVSDRTLEIELMDAGYVLERLPGLASIFLEFIDAYAQTENDLSAIGARVFDEATKYAD